MIETETCPQCGTGLSAGVLEGLCSRCLAGLAMGEAPLQTVPPARPVRAAPPEPALRVLGDYELLKEIGRGATGILYKARRISRDQIVAVKVLPSATEEFGRRLRAETEAAAANLHHPNIVALHEVGEHSGQWYYSMDFVDGHSLAALVRNGPLPARRAAAYIQKVAQALQYAHQSGILHRNLNPAQVLVGADDEPRLADFALVKPATQEPRSTAGGHLPAVAGALAPEQATGQWDAASPQSDVYALGVILYQLLTGRPPFLGETIQDTASLVLNSPPVPPRLLNPGTPPELESICLKCLEKNPRRRFATAQELADELGRYIRREPVLTRPEGGANQFWHWCRRRPALAGAVALLAATPAISTTVSVSLARARRVARADAYARDMNQAQIDWQDGSFSQAFDNLERSIPRGGESDLRGFEWRHLWQLARGTSAFKLPRQSQVVGALKFSPDGRSLATYRWDPSDPVRIWDLAARRERFRIPGAASLGGFSTNGRWLVVGMADGAVAVHDAENGKFIFSIPRVGEIVAFAPSANAVVAMDTNRDVLVLKLETQRPVTLLTNLARRYFDAGRAAPLTVTSDGRWLAVVRPGDGAEREDRGIEIFNADGTNGTNQSAFLPLRRQIRTLLFSPDGTRLAVGDADGWVHLCDWSKGETRPFQAHELPLLAMAFSPDGRTLATGSSDENIQFWDVATLEQKLKSCDGQIGPVWSLAFSPDGKFLASGSRDSPIRFWDLEAARPVDVIGDLKSDQYGNFAFAPDGHLMAGGCRDNTVRIWEAATLTERHRLTNACYAVGFSSDGKKLLAATADGAAQWWDFGAGTKKPVPEYAGVAQITSAGLSPDRRNAALGRNDGTIQLLEIDSGKILGTYPGHTDAVLAIAFAAGTTRFASGGRDKILRLWDANTPAAGLRAAEEHHGAIRALAISGDGRTLVSAGSDNTIKFWDSRRIDRSFASIHGHQAAIRTLALSPDDRILASGGDDKVVKLWDFRRHHVLANFKFAEAIQHVAFSPAGDNLAVVTEKGTLRLLRAVSLTDADEEYRAYYSQRR